MSFERINQSSPKNSQTSSSNYRSSSRPSSMQQPLSQEEAENQAFEENKFEAFGLQLKKKDGTITPIEQEKLGVLQAKMDSLWTQRMEQAKAKPNLLEILISNSQATQATEAAATIQPKLTIGQPNDQYEQEADEVAERVMSMSPPVTPNVQRYTEEEEQAQSETKLQASSQPNLLEILVNNAQASPAPEPAAPIQSQLAIGQPIRAIPRVPIQPKLTIGQPNDRYEQEADEVAERVMSMSPPVTPNVQRFSSEEEQAKIQPQPLVESITPILQRRREELEEEEHIQRQCEACEREEQIQRSPDGIASVQPNLENRLNASKVGGSPLSNEVRGFMEPRFGFDFSQVRVHTGSDAVQMNRELGAQAFTHGSDVYYAAGKAPGNNELTAHELTHVVQQTESNESASFYELQTSKNNTRIQRQIELATPGVGRGWSVERSRDEQSRVRVHAEALYFVNREATIIGHFNGFTLSLTQPLPQGGGVLQIRARLDFSIDNSGSNDETFTCWSITNWRVRVHGDGHIVMDAGHSNPISPHSQVRVAGVNVTQAGGGGQGYAQTTFEIQPLIQRSSDDTVSRERSSERSTERRRDTGRTTEVSVGGSTGTNVGIEFEPSIAGTEVGSVSMGGGGTIESGVTQGWSSSQGLSEGTTTSESRGRSRGRTESITPSNIPITMKVEFTYQRPDTQFTVPFPFASHIVPGSEVRDSISGQVAALQSWFMRQDQNLRARIATGEVPIHLTGYCSAPGSVDFNRRLARQRNAAVEEILRDFAGSDARITHSEFPEPIVGQGNQADDPVHQRVDILLVLPDRT